MSVKRFVRRILITIAWCADIAAGLCDDLIGWLE